ncbi:MAG: Hsp20 family protein [Chitinivibrionales bacterium]|nr:Hsp20 family protein [Chitinivibrionales bacterium]
MELVRYNRPTTLASLFDEVGDLFNGSFGWSNRELSNRLYPSVDIEEHDDHYSLKADLPGLDKKDIAIKVENGTLSISGEKKHESTRKEKEKYSYFERSFGRFERSFALPEHIDPEHIDARYKDGVLEVDLKKKPESKPKAIEVKVG